MKENKELIEYIIRITKEIRSREINRFLEKVLSVDAKERRELCKATYGLNKIKMFNAIPKLTDSLKLDTIEDYEERVKLRYEYILKHPDERHWDYAEYQEYKGEGKLIAYPKVLVSSYGEAVVMLEDRLLVMCSVGNKGISYIRLRVDIKKDIQLHRVIASTFIPKSERHKDVPYSELTTNHIDLTMINNRVDNLEWLTNKENVKHGCRYDNYTEYEYFLFEVVEYEPLKGERFILREDDTFFTTYLLGSVRNMLRLNCKFRKMKVTYPTKEELDTIPLGMPQHVKDALPLMKRKRK